VRTDANGRIDKRQAMMFCGQRVIAGPLLFREMDDVEVIVSLQPLISFVRPDEIDGSDKLRGGDGGQGDEGDAVAFLFLNTMFPGAGRKLPGANEKAGDFVSGGGESLGHGGISCADVAALRKSGKLWNGNANL
jgi:hypothetical protein